MYRKAALCLDGAIKYLKIIDEKLGKTEATQKTLSLNVSKRHNTNLTTGSTKAIHVLSCLCDNACKRSLAICRKSRALCLSLYDPHALNRDINMIQSINQKP